MADWKKVLATIGEDLLQKFSGKNKWILTTVNSPLLSQPQPKPLQGSQQVLKQTLK